MAFRIERNRGKEGLHIACNAITENYERSLFENHTFFPQGDYLFDAETTTPSRHGPATFTSQVFEIINAVGDTNLEENLCPPDHLECFHVPPKKLINKSQGISSFQFGEAVIVLILGMSAKLTLHLKENEEKKQEVIFLPRKSIVVFSGEARHARWNISNTGKDSCNCRVSEPTWNSPRFLRCLFLRSTKTYNTIWLNSMMDAAKNQQDKFLLMSRKQAERENWPERTVDGKPLNKKMLEEYEEIGKNNLQLLTHSRNANQRLPRSACTFLAHLDSSIADLYVDKPIPATTGALLPLSFVYYQDPTSPFLHIVAQESCNQSPSRAPLSPRISSVG